ncbi:F-type H+-transporting ATPase subunit epsilon [Ruminococcaceae bacterium YRB3002]|nr:F-type H+-transporting ATPase subunit epsilon [Ruminococcaceae bacterium YRB3002]
MAEAKKDNYTKLVIVTPYKTFYEGYAYIVTIPALDGELGIMAGHSPLVAAIRPGVLRILTEDGTKLLSCSEGYAEIGHRMVLVVCNSAEWPEEISITRIVKSYQDALKLLEEYKDFKTTKGTPITNDAINAIGRARARMHLIELAGSESQKNHLAQRKAELGL